MTSVRKRPCGIAHCAVSTQPVTSQANNKYLLRGQMDELEGCPASSQSRALDGDDVACRVIQDQ